LPPIASSRALTWALAATSSPQTKIEWSPRTRPGSTITAQLVEEGYVRREKRGRRNHYDVRREMPLRHPLVQEQEIGDLLDVLLRQRRGKDRGKAEDRG